MSTKSRLALGVLAIAGTFVFSDRSFACPDNQYNSYFLGACACLPKVGGDGARAFEHLKKEIPGQVGGAALDQWIIQSRNNAIIGAMPIPFDIRQALTG
jgi:hypothetical protein